MSKSFSATVISDLLKLWPKFKALECEQVFNTLFHDGEELCPPPFLMQTRYVDNENGRIFYLNEDSGSQYVIFYIHGGGYLYDIIPPQWRLIDKIIGGTDAQIVVPAYRLVPFATYKEAYELIVPEYKRYVEACPDKKIILMGDSAGGGLALALTECFKQEGIRMPDELVLISPWVDVAMDNEEIKKIAPEDPFLEIESLKTVAERWADDLDLHDWRVSPIYGDLKGIRNVTTFIGTSEIFYPDVVKLYHMLDQDPSNELVVGQDMLHVYPLLPIQEAGPAVDKIVEVVKR